MHLLFENDEVPGTLQPGEGGEQILSVLIRISWVGVCEWGQAVLGGAQ